MFRDFCRYQFSASSDEYKGILSFLDWRVRPCWLLKGSPHSLTDWLVIFAHTPLPPPAIQQSSCCSMALAASCYQTSAIAVAVGSSLAVSIPYWPVLIRLACVCFLARYSLCWGCSSYWWVLVVLSMLWSVSFHRPFQVSLPTFLQAPPPNLGLSNFIWRYHVLILTKDHVPRGLSCDIIANETVRVHSHFYFLLFLLLWVIYFQFILRSVVQFKWKSVKDVVGLVHSFISFYFIYMQWSTSTAG